MDVSEQSGTLLDLPEKAVTALRAILGAAGIEPPVLMVQLVVLAISVTILYALWRLFRAEGRPAEKAILGMGAIVALAAIVGIAWFWSDHWLHPPIGQVHGRIAIAPGASPQIELLDYLDRPIGVVDRASGSDRFVASYPPSIDDLPKTIRASDGDCQTTVALARRHLQFGEPVTLTVRCGDGE
jgi:hypothetical protein